MKASQELINKIGDRIKLLRKGKGLSQLDISTACNMEKTAISRIEAGRTNFTIDTLYKISNVLEIPVWELVKVDD